jgi:hypothetical protein
MAGDVTAGSVEVETSPGQIPSSASSVADLLPPSNPAIYFYQSTAVMTLKFKFT